MEIRKKRLIALVPVEFIWSQELNLGVEAFLQAKLNSWDQKLLGIIKSYNGIKILTKKCKILDDISLLLVKVKYTVSYYFPTINSQLIGVVRNWNQSEIGVLVDCFNTVIINEEGIFDGANWKDKNSKEIVKGSKVKFTLTK